MSKTYKVNVSLVFKGTCDVVADTVFEARHIAQQHMHACQPVITDDEDSRITSWDINSHADTEVWFNQNGQGLEELDN